VAVTERLYSLVTLIIDIAFSERYVVNSQLLRSLFRPSVTVCLRRAWAV